MAAEKVLIQQSSRCKEKQVKMNFVFLGKIMPQLLLEFSSNVIEKSNLHNLFQECHTILAKTLPTDIDSCKSRGIECHSYYIGNGQPNNAFVHVTLKVMPGRSFEILQNLGIRLMEVLKNYFTESLKKKNLQITLEIIELQKTYFKIIS